MNREQVRQQCFTGLYVVLKMSQKYTSPVESVRVAAAARLHLGFLDLNGGLERRFGSIGVGVKGLSTVVNVSRGNQIRGSEINGADNEYIAQIAATILDYFQINSGVEIEVESCPPRHQGLGSGTQMSLALGIAITSLYGIDAGVEDIAIATGRGRRSGIGIGVFKHGGFILDSGRGDGRPLPTLISHYDFPEEWRFVLVFDEQAEGISGWGELEAFKALPDISCQVAGEICRLVLMQTLPGIIEKDCNQFGRSINRIQTRCGEYFERAQGGLFSSKNVKSAIEFLLENKATGGGQTSWGPTGFAIFPDKKSAIEAMDNFNKQSGENNTVRLQLTEAENNKTRIRRQKTRGG